MLFSIMACSLGFHAITSERSFLKNEACVALNPSVSSLFGRFVARGGRKRGNRHTHIETDRQTHRPSTVTLAAHAR